MKKSIVALAVSSAALASVSAYAAEDTTASFYGNIQYAYVTTSPSTESGKLDTHEFNDNGSSFGFKGESTVSDQTKAFFNIKYKIDATQKSSNASVTMDNAYVGLKGNFGTVKAGSYDSIYNDAIQDPIDQFEYVGFTNATTAAEGKSVAYFTPSISGFQLQLEAGTGTKATDTAGTTYTTNTKTNWTGVLKYSNDMVTVALGYDNLANKNTAGSELSSTTGLSVAFTGVENLSVTAKYEVAKDDKGSNAGEKNLGLAARYSYGMGDVYGSIQKVDQDASTAIDYTEYAAGVTYSLNSSMYVYTELGKLGSDKATTSVLGVTYVW